MENSLSTIDKSVYGHCYKKAQFVKIEPLVEPPLTALSDLSERDKAWDGHRSDNDILQTFCVTVETHQRWAERMNGCSGLIKFIVVNTPDGKKALKLDYAYFCRVRHCPVCQWRKQLLWRARMFALLPEITEEHPTARWVFLTLTVPNCKVEDLRSTLKDMNSAWQRLSQRKVFTDNVIGWLRTTEVTQEKKRNGYAHPHFHVLLLVKPSYFGKGYIKQEKWWQLWCEATRNPNINQGAINVKAVKAGTGQDSLHLAVCETLKYSVKPADLVADKDWFLTMSTQVHKMRFTASGGVLKDCLNGIEDASNEEMLMKKQQEKEELDELRESSTQLAFAWYPKHKRYLFNEKHSEIRL